MNIVKTVLAAATLLLLVFSGCGGDIETGNPDDFVVDLRELRLNPKIPTVYDVPVTPNALGFSKVPSFATRDAVIWSSSDKDVAEVDSDGNITITTGDTVTDNPVSTTIKVASVHDPSIYAESVLTVYPKYPLPRIWNFAAGTVKVNGAAITAGTTGTSSTWGDQTSDADLGNGAAITARTGAGSGYNSRGPGEWPIDPEDPYAYGIELSGQSRVWQYGTSVGSNQQPANPMLTHTIKPNGIARFVEINALFSPFKIEVSYQGNSNGTSHVDIRIGDTEGVRIEGEDSTSSGSAQVKTVSYIFEEPGVFVPVVYLETNATTRIWRIEITEEGYFPIEAVAINSHDEVAVNRTITLTAALTPPHTTSPEYRWEIVSGGSYGSISGATTNATATLRGTAVGSVTVKVTVTSTDPDDPANKTSKTAEKTITVGPAPVPSNYTWSAASVTSNTTLSNATAVDMGGGTYWQRGGGSITITNSGASIITGSRFVIGTSERSSMTATTADVHVDGTLDFSIRAKVYIDYDSLEGNLLQVNVNNNTTSSAASVLGGSSRIFNGGRAGSGTQVAASGTLDLTIDPASFSNHASLSQAFLMIRCGDGSNPTTVNITGIRIQYE